MNNNEKLMELYTLAFAPLGPDTLLGDIKDLGPDDIAPDLVLDEVAYVDKLQRFGFSKFVKYLEEYRDAEPHSAPQEVGAAVDCFCAYLKRVRSLNGALLDMVEQLTAQYGDCTPTLKAYETEIRSTNRRPLATADFSGILDMTPNCRWSVAEDTGPRRAAGVGGRVGFKETTRVLTGENQEAEEALKVSEIKRKKQRNPTGYQKFTFRDLGLSESDVAFAEDLQSGPVSTSASSVAGRDSRASSEGGSSARSSVGPGDSVADECRRQEELNPFKAGDHSRSGSLVAFSFEREREEIEDDFADPEWATQQRHAKRFSRIRNRVPTGHPSMMKKSSDELHQLINDLDEVVEVPQTGGDPPAAPTATVAPQGPTAIFDNETVKNTVLNRRTSTAITSPEAAD